MSVSNDTSASASSSPSTSVDNISTNTTTTTTAMETTFLSTDLSSLSITDSADFYEHGQGYYWSFSNYCETSITIDGLLYNSVEHWYQSNKFTCSVYKEIIRKAKTPHQSKVFASLVIAKSGYDWRMALNKTIQKHLDLGLQVRPDWEDIKESIMAKGIEAKFTQHPSLKTILLSTGDKLIRETSPRDSYWGTGSDGQGKNRLGYLLMDLRKTLSKSKPKPRQQRQQVLPIPAPKVKVKEPESSPSPKQSPNVPKHNNQSSFKRFFSHTKSTSDITKEGGVSNTKTKEKNNKNKKAKLSKFFVDDDTFSF